MILQMFACHDFWAKNILCWWVPSLNHQGLHLSVEHQDQGFGALVSKANANKKAELSQRWPRDAPYIWVPWKLSRVLEYAHGYFCRNFYWAFVPIDSMIQNLKFVALPIPEIIGGYSKNLGSPWIRLRSLFSQICMGFCSDGPSECIGQMCSQ